MGSIFTLTLPWHDGLELGSPRSGRTKSDVYRLQTGQKKVDKPVVLAIDDDPDVIYLLRENLAGAGYDVIGATDGNEGWQKARELQPFAITLDIMMPQPDGWQVLHQLKSDPATRHIPVILLTIVDRKDLGYQLGASDYLVKPLDPEAVLAALERLTQVNGGIRPKRLLLVDDDPQVADMVNQLLETALYELETAQDGLAALQAVAQHRPDAILLDLMMPRLDGFGVIEQVRQNPETCSIPIIVLTAQSLPDEDVARLQESVTQVMQKQGLTGEILLQKLQQALGQFAIDN